VKDYLIKLSELVEEMKTDAGKDKNKNKGRAESIKIGGRSGSEIF